VLPGALEPRPDDVRELDEVVRDALERAVVLRAERARLVLRPQVDMFPSTVPSRCRSPAEWVTSTPASGALGVFRGEVVPEQLGEGGHRGVPSERAVGAVVIVEVDEPVVGRSALVL
jgi:hypothetical protein